MVVSVAAKHAEIALRHNGEARARRAERAAERPAHRAPFRVKDITQLFADRYGGQRLPDDDSGRDDARILADHVAYLAGDQRRNIFNWMRQWAPWMEQDELDRLITNVLAKPLRYGAAKLGQRLNLTREERARLKITTFRAVGQTADQLEAEREARRRDAKRLKGRKAGAKPRDEYEAGSAERLKPWVVEGVSRRTWYRRRLSPEATPQQPSSETP